MNKLLFLLTTVVADCRFVILNAYGITKLFYSDNTLCFYPPLCFTQCANCCRESVCFSGEASLSQKYAAERRQMFEEIYNFDLVTEHFSVNPQLLVKLGVYEYTDQFLQRSFSNMFTVVLFYRQNERHITHRVVENFDIESSSLG